MTLEQKMKFISDYRKVWTLSDSKETKDAGKVVKLAYKCYNFITQILDKLEKEENIPDVLKQLESQTRAIRVDISREITLMKSNKQWTYNISFYNYLQLIESIINN